MGVNNVTTSNDTMISSAVIGWSLTCWANTTMLFQQDKPSALQCRGVVSKVGCVDCNFMYYGQTDRALETRLQKNKEGRFGLETTIPKLHTMRTSLSIV